MTERTLWVSCDSAATLVGQQSHVEHGGLFFPVPDPAPDLLTDITVCVTTPFGVAELVVKVVHVAAGSGMALTFQDADSARASLAPLLEAARAAEPEAGAVPLLPKWGRPPQEEKPLKQAGGRAAGDEGTLHDHVRSMSVQERMQLARHGGRAERRILMTDPNKNVHTFLIQNPRITLDEVRAMAGQRQTNPDVLVMISKSREWTQSPAVVQSLVRNPKTPSVVAVRLLDRLPEAELRRLARSNDVPRQISQAARRKISAGR